ncbi:PREDICTED: cytosolic phospholipase A2-like [Acropora digitifera]|uniref:cytosolic phospholipase A2-like n=1 Tax=Acropora digitifera TaxID=70779 RepID=UPI000779F330|nr:PREDICTED: cytosolic phospholipase A2-like [Acropora digitifera]
MGSTSSKKLDSDVTTQEEISEQNNGNKAVRDSSKQETPIKPAEEPEPGELNKERGDGNSSVSLSGAARKEKLPRVFQATPRPCFLLHVKVLRGHNVTLGKLHDFVDTPDPYVKLSIPTSPFGFRKTKTKSNTADPVWNEVFSFYLDRTLKNVLEITLLDSDVLLDDLVATKTFDLSTLELGKTHAKTFVFYKETSVDVEMILQTCAEPSEMRYSTELCEKERTFIEKRKKSVFNAMREFLGEHRGPQTVEEVPNVAILGSGGGFRAMVSLSGVFCALKDMGVMDCTMYAAGLSGSAWYLSTLYSHPDWPNIHPRQVREQLRKNVNDNWLWMMLKPSWTYRRLRIIMDKKRRGQPVSFTDFFGYLVGETIMKDRKEQPILSEQQPKVQDAEVPFPLYSCVHVKKDVSAQEYCEWMEFSPHEIGMPKYGTFMQTEHFGSKFFCGKLVKHYKEPPLFYLQGIWGSAFTILLQRVLQNGKLPDDTTKDNRNKGDLRDELEEMLKEKDEEDGLSEDDEEEQSDEETHANDISTSNDETEEEDEEENTFLQRLCNTLVDNIKLLKTRAGRAGLINNFLRGLSVPCFSEEIEDVADTAEQLALSAKHIYLVDSGLVFNSPFPPLLRLERNVDIFLSFDFSMREKDLEFPFQELLLAEKWARENNFKFPPIDAEMQYEKFGMKEFYVFRDPNDPSCPVVVHFVLVNNKFKEEIKTGVPRPKKEGKDYANFSLFEDPDDCYSTFNFHYPSEQFNKLADLNEFNTLLAGKTIQDVIADCIQSKRSSNLR